MKSCKQATSKQYRTNGKSRKILKEQHGILIGKSHEWFGECGYCSVCRKLNLIGSKKCQWCDAIFDDEEPDRYYS